MGSRFSSFVTEKAQPVLATDPPPAAIGVSVECGSVSWFSGVGCVADLDRKPQFFGI
jgi:hypothetical protein